MRINQDSIEYPAVQRGDEEPPILVFWLLFTLLVIFMILMFAYVVAQIIPAKDQGEPSGQVKVSLTVPSALSYSEIFAGDAKGLKVIGNYEKGFQIINAATGMLVYDYAKMPGEGVVIKVGNDIHSLILVPKY